MTQRTFVIGVGMTKFEKPGAQDWDYPDMAQEAGTKALDDAGIAYDEIEQAARRLLLRRLHRAASARSTSSA